MEDADRRLLLTGAGFAGLAALATTARAGSLEPPGPPGPTGRTVQEIYDKVARTTAGLAEPRIPVQSLASSASAQFVIAAPGAYYLADNVTGVAGKHGIQVTASGVSIDLAGHTMTGAAGTLQGIRAEAGAAAVRVTGGTLRGWSQGAVSIAGSGGTVTDLTVEGGGAGIDVAPGGTVARCTVRSVGAVGIACTGLVSQCVVSGVGGFAVQCTGTVDSCDITGPAFAGVSAGQATLVTRTRIENATDGVVIHGEGCLVRECLIRGSSGARGVATASAAASDALIEGNQILRYTIGIVVNGPGAVVRGNAIYASAFGIQVTGGGTALVVGNAVRGMAQATAYALNAASKSGPLVTAAGSIASTSPWANFFE